MENSAIIETIIISLSILIGILVTIAGPKLADIFCSIQLTEEARLRQERVQNMMRSKQIPIILSNITVEERNAILLQVLDIRRWPSCAKQNENNDDVVVVSSSSSREESDDDDNSDAVTSEKNKSSSNLNPYMMDSTDDEENPRNDIPPMNGEQLENQQDDEHQNTCAICMEDYKDKDDVILGATCSHMYHKECVLKWIAANHICCPYCRDFFFDVSTFLSVAENNVLGLERYRDVLVVRDESRSSTAASSATVGDNIEIVP